MLILSPSLEAYDAYLQLSKGGQPVANDGNSSWVQIRGFSQGVENPVNVGSATGGLGSGKVEGDTVTLHIVSNGLIAEMMKGVAMGDLYEIKLQLARRGTDEAYTSVMTEIVFDKVVFSKVATGATDGDDALVFDVSYKYGELTVKHTAIDLAENVTSTTGAGWTFIGNEPMIPRQDCQCFKQNRSRTIVTHLPLYILNLSSNLI